MKHSDDASEEYLNIKATKEGFSKENIPKDNTTKEVFSNGYLETYDADFIKYSANDGVIKAMKKSQASKFPKSHPARIG